MIQSAEAAVHNVPESPDATSSIDCLRADKTCAQPVRGRGSSRFIHCGSIVP